MDIVDDDKSSVERTARISNITLVINDDEQERSINNTQPPHINDDISLDDATVDSVATFIDYVSLVIVCSYSVLIASLINSQYYLARLSHQ